MPVKKKTKSVAKPKRKTAPKKKPTYTTNEYILLDRSGSMSDRWVEAIHSINTYVAELQKKKQHARITVAAFDENSGFQYDVVRNGVSLNHWEPLTNKDAQPRGGTPLFDAIKRAIESAEGLRSKRTVFIVMTDGEENASRHTTRAQVQSALQRVKERGWQVVFLGADFDAVSQGAELGVSMDSCIVTTSGNYAKTMSNLAATRSAYASSGSAMCFSEIDRTEAVGGKVNTSTATKGK